jgi:hypothetical protein
MQRNSMSVYTQYRRLLVLLLIFPIYKLVVALNEGDTLMAYLMIVFLTIGVIAIIYLERKLGTAQQSGRRPPAEKK